MLAFLFGPKHEIFPQGIDYEVLREVSELYLSRRPKKPSFEDFHWFTMDILRKYELTPLERSYKEIIKMIIKDRVNQGGAADFVLFEDIEVSNCECCLHVRFYEKYVDDGSDSRYEVYRKAFGKIIKSSRKQYHPFTTVEIRDKYTMTRVKNVLSMF